MQCNLRLASCLVVLWCATAEAQTRAARAGDIPAPAKISTPGWSEISNLYGLATREFPREGVMLGQGWNSFSGRKTVGFCIEGFEREIKDVALSRVSFKRVDDTESFLKIIEASASGSYSGGLYSASGKVEYSKSVKIDTQSLNIVASVNLESGLRVMHPFEAADGTIKAASFQLNPESLSLLKTNPTAFRRRCGDSFVIGVRSGGEMHAFMQFKLAGKETKESLFASLKASGLNASGSASFKQVVEEKIKSEQFDYNFYQTGSSSANNPTSIDDLIARITQFGSKKENYTPSPYQIYMINYAQLAEYAGRENQSADSEELNRLANQYFRLTDANRQYSDVIMNPSQYQIGIHYQNMSGLYSVQRSILQSGKIADIALRRCFESAGCPKDGFVGAVINQSARADSDDIKGLIGPPSLLSLSLSTIAYRVSDDVRKRSADIIGQYESVNKNNEASNKGLAADEIKIAAQQDVEELAKYIEGGKGGPSLSDYELYYQIVAAKPLHINELNIRSFVYLPDNRTVHPFLVFMKVDLVGYTKSSLKAWILTQRLMPISQSFCADSMTHPMCISATRLAEIVETVPLFIDAGLLLPDPPAEIAPPPAATPKPVPAPKDPCDRPGAWHYCR